MASEDDATAKATPVAAEQSKDPKDPKDPKDSKDPKDPKDARDVKDAKDVAPREVRDDKINEKLAERIRSQPTEPPADKLTETIRQRLEHLVPELVKKTFAAGMGAVFSTEEGIRKIARDVSLPDVVGYVASSADGAKDKVFEVIARETRDFLSNLNLTDEIAKLLTTLSFEIKTEIRFIPNSEKFTGTEPDVKASVRLKRNESRSDGRDEPEPRDSRSRLRFWRREDGTPGDDGDDDDGK